MRLLFFITLFFVVTFSNSWSLFHKKEEKYVCSETSNGKKFLYIFDIKNKKVYQDIKTDDGFDLVIGDNYYAWKMKSYDLIDGGIFYENGRLMIVDTVHILLNTDTKQLTLEAEESVATKQFNKKRVTKYQNCKKL
ncbi:hypothetical protein [Candidatus Pelagibacter sp.]|uniref:hypothetical protein n=1 Tax=Candidatus Pelagibacter sp. TaxID=2024849 RepID=UPI003D0F8ADB